MKSAASVEEYISLAPVQIREKLRQLRRAVRETAPDATEKISYGMPYYGYKGRLAYFAYFKDHISFFAMPPVPENLEHDVQKYMTGKSTMRFALNDKLPITLIKRIIRARVKRNDSALKK